MSRYSNSCSCGCGAPQQCCHPIPSPPPPKVKTAEVRFGIVKDGDAVTINVIAASPLITIFHKNAQYTILLPTILNVEEDNTELYSFFIAEPVEQPSKKKALLERNISSPFLQQSIQSPNYTVQIVDNYRVYLMQPEMGQYFNGDFFGNLTLSTIEGISI